MWSLISRHLIKRRSNKKPRTKYNIVIGGLKSKVIIGDDLMVNGHIMSDAINEDKKVKEYADSLFLGPKYKYTDEQVEAIDKKYKY